VYATLARQSNPALGAGNFKLTRYQRGSPLGDGRIDKRRHPMNFRGRESGQRESPAKAPLTLS
jgi:hypothetical protein